MWFFNCFHKFSFSNPWEQFLNIYQGIMLPSLPVSILYGIITLLSLACMPYLINFCSCILNWYSPFQYHLPSTPWTPPAPSHWSPCSFYSGRPSWSVLLYCTLHVLLYVGHCLGWCIPPQYLHGFHCVVSCTGALILSSFAFFDILILSNCFGSVNVLSSAALALCTSTLIAHAHIPPLVMWSSF